MRLKHPTIEARLRARKYDGLDPDAVEELLGPKPVHMYDISDQPQWVKDARQWLYDARLPEFIYPVHLHSAGLCGDVRSPMTWFRCKTCGDRDLGSPYALPDGECHMCMFARREFTGWEVADKGTALRATAKACDGNADLIGRVLR